MLVYMNNKGEQNDKLMSSSLFIGALTLSGYLVAFFYEYGYISYFGIPPYLIELSISNILIAISALFFSIFLLITVIDILAQFDLFDGNTAISRARREYLVHVIFACFFIFNYGFELKYLILFIIIYLFFIFFIYFFPVIFKKKSSDLEKKYQVQENLESEIIQKGFYYKILQLVGVQTYRIIVFCVVCVVASYVIGQGEAVRQYEYMVLDTNKVLIRVYNDNIIMVTFNRDSREFNNEIILKDLEYFNKIEFVSMEKIGPLKSRKN